MILNKKIATILLLLAQLVVMTMGGNGLNSVFAAYPNDYAGYTGVVSMTDFPTTAPTGWTQNYASGGTDAYLVPGGDLNSSAYKDTTGVQRVIAGARYKLDSPISGKVAIEFYISNIAMTTTDSTQYRPFEIMNSSGQILFSVDNFFRIVSGKLRLFNGQAFTTDMRVDMTSWYKVVVYLDTTTETNNVSTTFYKPDGSLDSTITASHTALKDKNIQYICFGGNKKLGFDNISIYNSVPTATNVVISGNTEVGQTLTGSYTYSYAGTLESGSTFRWLRADSKDGNYTEISGANATTYKTTENDASKYIKFEVTPKAVNGTVFGTAVQSEGVGAIQATPQALNVIISGVPKVGSTVLANYTYSDGNGDLESGSVYRWLTADSIDGTYTEILGATGTTDAAHGSQYVIKESDRDKSIKFEITPRNTNPPTTGSTVYSNIIIIKDLPPTANNVKIAGTVAVGQTLVGSYTFADPNLDNEQGSTYRWLRGNTSSGPFDVVLDSGSVSSTSTVQYSITEADTNKYIVFEVTPRSDAEPRLGQVIQSTPTVAVAAPPLVTNITISGSAYLNDTLRGEYSFTDPNGDGEGTSLYRWLMADSETGTLSPIQGATNRTYTVTDINSDKWLVFEVTPVSVKPPVGTAVKSAPIHIPMSVIYSVNETFETDSNGATYQVDDIVKNWIGSPYIHKDTDSTNYIMGKSSSSGSTGLLLVAKQFDIVPNGKVFIDYKMKGINIYSYGYLTEVYADGNPTRLFGLANSATYKILLNASTDLSGVMTEGAWYNIRLEMDTKADTDNLKIYINNQLKNTSTIAEIKNAAINKICFGSIASIDDIKVSYPVPPVVSNVSVGGNAIAGETLTGNYAYNYFGSSVDGGSSFKWYSSDTLDGTYTEISNATQSTYTLTNNQSGKFVKFEVTPKYGTNAGIAVTSLAVGRVLGWPEAKNIVLKGIPNVGSTIHADYEYSDENGDAEQGSSFRWLSSETLDGAYTNVLHSGITTAVLGADYTFVDSDINKYIKFEITPKSANEPYVGGALLSDETLTLVPVAPIVSNVTVTGDKIVGGTLTGTYKYFDSNRDEESGSTYRWLRSNSPTEPFDYEIARGTCTANDTINYIITLADSNKYIKLEITAKNMATVKNLGNAVLGSSTDKILTPPEAKNPNISGDSYPNGTLRATYDFYDDNGDSEGQSTYRWLRGNGTGSYDVVALGSKVYDVTSDDVGKSIIFEVTPVSTNYPYSGSASTSAPITITNKTTSVTVSGGGGGGGGGVIYIPPVLPLIDSGVIVFADMKNHWARENIEFLASKKIINGVSDSDFAPDVTITRAEFVTMVVRVLGIDLDKSQNLFNDVKDNSWYADYVQTAFNSKLIAGSDGSFRPLDAVTREEMTKIIIEAYKLKKATVIESNPQDFKDSVDISGWAENYVKQAFALKIINGMDDGKFYPKDNATRAQAGSVIFRLYNLIFK